MRTMTPAEEIKARWALLRRDRTPSLEMLAGEKTGARKSTAEIKDEHLAKTGRELNHREAVHRFYAQEKTAMDHGLFHALVKVADVSKEELRAELKRHEERETPAQEAAESKHEQDVEQRAGVEKGAGFSAHMAKHLPTYLAGTAALGSVGSAIGSNRKANAAERAQAKTANALTAEGRNDLPASDFVYPKERRFPIHDRAHAKNALARAHFAPDPARVRAAVHAKYPDLAGEKTASFFAGFEKSATTYSLPHGSPEQLTKAKHLLRNLAGAAKK